MEIQIGDICRTNLSQPGGVTDGQKRMIAALSYCTFLPGSYPKRFVRDMRWRMENEPDTELSEKQAAYLEKLAWMYRKQIKAKVPNWDGGWE